MLRSNNNNEKLIAQHLPQNEHVAYPHATQCLCINQVVIQSSKCSPYFMILMEQNDSSPNASLKQ